MRDLFYSKIFSSSSDFCIFGQWKAYTSSTECLHVVMWNYHWYLRIMCNFFMKEKLHRPEWKSIKFIFNLMSNKKKNLISAFLLIIFHQCFICNSVPNIVDGLPALFSAFHRWLEQTDQQGPFWQIGNLECVMKVDTRQIAPHTTFMVAIWRNSNEHFFQFQILAFMAICRGNMETPRIAIT